MIHNHINWQPYSRWKHKKADDLIEEWLLNCQSMTQQLRSTCSKIEIKLLAQKWRFLSIATAKKLGLNMHGPTMVREVQIICDHEVWISAATFISKKHFPELNHSFKCLGTRPLGDLLFKKQQWDRYKIDFATLKYQIAPFEFLNVLSFDNNFLYCRRSFFKKGHKELMLIEVFNSQMWNTLKKLTRHAE
jgi:chorismate-pyruvate lyase